MTITHQALKEWLSYDPETGVFRWLKDKRGRGRMWKAGDAAGYETQTAVCICLMGRYYYAHRLAWFYVHGEWPKQQIDHINGEWRDNLLSNLRDVPPRVNMENMRFARKTSRSGLIGAFKHSVSGWFSAIQVHGKMHRLGHFKTPQEAHEAYIAAKRVLHEGCTL